jgi:hypothetical protein
MLKLVPFVAVAVVVAALCLLALRDEGILRRAHARPRAHLLNALRTVLGVSAALVVLLNLHQPLVAAPLTLIAVALGFVPCGWIIRGSGGREPDWELRHLGWEAAVLRKSDPPAPTDRKLRERMQALVNRMEEARRPETSELCGLYIADCLDWLSTPSSPFARGWRAIRASEIENRLFGSSTASALADPAEATFRWRLFRRLWWLQTSGPRDSMARGRLTQILADLEKSRRPDTARLIDLVRESAESWLSDARTNEPWTEYVGASELGSAIQAEGYKFWRTIGVFIGAELDDEDAAYLEEPAIREDILRLADQTRSFQR